MKKEQQDERDELGLTSSDYEEMCALKDRDGKLNDTLLSGWDITPEQITLINDTLHPLHYAAVVAFYDVNFKRLWNSAFRFLAPTSSHRHLIAVVSIDDLLQQVFVDLLGGFLKLPHNAKQISCAIHKCFKYAAVGGLEGVDNVEERRIA